MNIQKLLFTGALALTTSIAYSQEQWDLNTSGQITYTGGNVGIGYNSPSAQLIVGSSFGAAISGSGGGNAVFGTNIAIYNGGANHNQLYSPYSHNSNYGFAGIHAKWGKIYFYTSDENTTAGSLVSPSTRMLIDSDGSVGIGNTTPISKVHVSTSEDALSWNMTLNNTLNNSTVSNYGVGIKLKHSGNHEDKWGGIASVQETSWANGSGLAFYANETEYLRIKRDGNVGIGTTNPTEKLHVNGNTQIEGNVSIIGNQIRFSEARGFDYDPTKDAIFYNGYNNGQVAMLSDRNGNSWFEGKVGIGTTNPDSKLTVNGTIHSKEVKVDLSVPGPDYVFEPDYNLKSLEETAAYIKANKHLPEIPSAKEMEANGVQLGEMNMLLLKKIEELTLYLINQEKRIQELEKVNKN